MVKYPNSTIKAITDFLFIETPKEEMKGVDLTLVFGSDCIEITVQEIRKLIDEGIILLGSKIVLSGATGLLNSESEKESLAMYRCAVEEYEIPIEMLVIEDRATNGYENLKYCKETVENNKSAFPLANGLDDFNKILIIAKSFMMRRVEMGARALGYPMDKLVYHGIVDIEGKNIASDCWWENEAAVRRVYGEIERIGKYAGQGNLTIFE